MVRNLVEQEAWDTLISAFRAEEEAKVAVAQPHQSPLLKGMNAARRERTHFQRLRAAKALIDTARDSALG